MTKKILAVVFGAMVMFAWGFFSWVVLPWHMSVVNQFSNEDVVSQVLKENSPQSGVYFLPFSEEKAKPGQPMAFINILPNGCDVGMGQTMAIGFVGNLLSVSLIVLLLFYTTGLNYFQRLGFIVLVGLTIAFVSHFPYWCYFGFSTSYILVTIADVVISWLLVGFVVAKLVTGKNVE